MAQRFPLNVILSAVVAALYGVIIGVITVHLTAKSVLLVVGITWVMVFVITALAWTNNDFTKFRVFICVIGEIF